MMKLHRAVAVALALISAPAFAAEQSSYVVPTTAPPGARDFGSIVQNYINPGLRALASCNNGPTAPANGPSGGVLPGQCWFDTSASPTINLKYWDGAAWATLASLDSSAHSFLIQSSSPIRNVTGTSDTLLDGDRGKMIDVNNASGVAQTLPQAGASSTFLSGWSVTVRNSGAGTLTITPTTSTIDGAASLTVRPGQTFAIRSDGTNYKTSLPQQPYNANLAALAALTAATDKCFYFSSGSALATFDCPSWARDVISAATLSAGRAAFGLAIGSDVQAYNANLAAWAGLTGASGKVGYFTGPGALAMADSTSFGRSVLNVADAAALRSLASAVIGTNVQAWDTDLDCLAALSGTGILRRTGGGTCSAGTTVAVTEGGTGGTSMAQHEIWIGSAANTVIKKSIPNCPSSSGFLNYSTSTQDFTCGAGGSGGGLDDATRQSILLSHAYQAKLQAGYRRLINVFADGFKASDGINAGSSSLYTLNTGTGFVAPTAVSLSYTNSATVSGTLSFGPNYTYVNRQTAITNGVTVCYLGISLAGAETVTLKIIQRDSSTQNDVVFSQSFAHPGGGYADLTMSSCYTVPGSGTYYPAVWFNSSASRTATVSGGRSYYNGDPTVQNNLTGWTDDTAQGPALRWARAGTPGDMVLVTTMQTADASVSYGRVLLEFDNSASPTLNTDLTVEVTCNNGTNWAAATLSAVSSYSQSSRKVAETTDTTCTAGTQWAARIKTFNGKDVKIYAATLTVH